MSAEWDLNAYASVVGGQLLLAPTATVSATATFNPPTGLPWSYGEPFIVLSLTSDSTSAGCRVDTKGSGAAILHHDLTTTGTQSFSIAATLAPADTLDLLKIICAPGSGSATVDWIASQNGDYPFAPLDDIELSFDTMGTPYEGRTTFVRTSEDQSTIFAGSDGGGLGWSTDGHDWHTANGDENDWYPLQRYGAWDVWSTASATDAGDSFVLTGMNNDGRFGGLWYSHDVGAHWKPLIGHSPEHVSDTRLGGARTLNDCGESNYASGRLLVTNTNWSTDSTAWLYVASQEAESRGVWAQRMSTANSPSPLLCQPYDPATLPTPDMFPDTDDDDEGYTAIPSALETGSLPAGGTQADYLLVGYRPLAGTDAVAAAATDPSVLNALYLCPTIDGQTDCSDRPACMPVVDTTDGDYLRGIRDIERDPLHVNRFFLVEDGVEVTDTNTCTPIDRDSSVWVLDVTPDVGTGFAFTLWNTDDLVDDYPTWSEDSTPDPASYYGATSTCPGGATDDPTYGDLVPPTSVLTSEASKPNGIEADPGGDWLFTFYNSSSGAYGCASIFRAAIPTDLAEDDTLPWQPFQSWVAGEMAFDTSTRNATRREAVDPAAAFMKDEPMQEAWPAGLTDGIFVDGVNVHGEEGTHLLLGGNHVWWLPQEYAGAAAHPGWDTSDHQDLDAVPFILAFDEEDGGPAFQSAQMRAVTSFPGALTDESGNRDELISANGDYLTFRLYGGDPAYRPPASRPCNFAMTGLVGVDVAGWSDPEDPATRQVWLLGNKPDGVDYDPALGRGLFLSRDGGDEWCWDGMSDDDASAAQLANDNHLKPDAVTSEWFLHCQDQGHDLVDSLGSPVAAHPGWEACKTSNFADPFNMDVDPLNGDPVGLPRKIVALGEGIALVAASRACQSDTFNCDPGDAVGEGLWVVRDGGSTGLSYTKVVLPSNTCTEADLFATTAIRGLAVHPGSGDSNAEMVDAFVVSSASNCGLVEITFTLGSEDTSADLAVISTHPDTDAGGAIPEYPDCSLSAAAMLGVSVGPDGDWLYAYGGYAHYSDAYADGGVCAIDLTGDYVHGAGQENAVTPVEARFAIHTLLPHPHVQAVSWFAGWADEGCLACMPTGVYEVQHRYKPATDTWAWGSRRISGEDLGFKGVYEMTWGGGDDVDLDAPYLMNLYLATPGGGFWDGAVEW